MRLMANFVATFEYTSRTIEGVKTVSAQKSFAESKSELSVKRQITKLAKMHQVEDFKLIGIDEYECLDCRDRGVLLHDGTACFC